MIDTMKILLERAVSDKIDIIQKSKEIKINMDNIKIKNDIYIFNGYIENLRVSQHHKGITIEGSFPKYLYGDNLQTLSFDNIYDVVDNISNILNVDFRYANILRLDIVLDMALRYSPNNYLPMLVDYPRCTRLTIDDVTLIFKNIVKELIFYDKGAELRANIMKKVNHRSTLKHDSIPSNLMRYEFRMKKIRNILKSKLYLKDLNNMSIREKIIDMPRHHYNKILKEPSTLPPFIIPEGQDLVKILSAYGSNTVGGMNHVNIEIDRLFSQNTINKSKKWRWKRFTRDITKLMQYIATDDLITELNDKINETTESALTTYL